ncbi:MAG: hypothetical protein MUE32_06220 [Bacteroidales bacterium]|jgi:hypothetical protein|nr:hypothetical protein [Bacteroidales bacterium]
MKQDGNRIMQQVSAIFSVFMVFFYIGVGVYLAFYFDNTYLDKPVLVMFGSAFIFYGLFRAYRAYLAIKALFFDNY